MDILTFLEAILKLGIPMVILSWIIFNLLYVDGDLDREADRRTVDAQVKKIKKSFKKKKGSGHANYVLAKWMSFGSGFYGLAALWTFVVIELVDIIRLILNPSAIAGLLDDGFIAAAIGLLMNQIANIVSAFVWFSYWSDGNVITWLLVAYAGYWVGMELARRDDDWPIHDWLQKLKSRLP